VNRLSLIPYPHNPTWHKSKVINNLGYTICLACDGMGYVHKQSFYMENEKMVSELSKDKDCFKCKGTGYILNINGKNS